MRPNWKALKFRGSTVLPGTYWLVSQSETQMTFTVKASFQAVKKQNTSKNPLQKNIKQKNPHQTNINTLL